MGSLLSCSKQTDLLFKAYRTAALDAKRCFSERAELQEPGTLRECCKSQERCQRRCRSQDLSVDRTAWRLFAVVCGHKHH